MYHDEGTVFVGFLTQGIQFGDRVIESLFGKMTRSVWRVQDLVVEDREVEGKAETDLELDSNRQGRYRMGGRQFRDSDIGSGFVRLEGLVSAILARVAKSEFREIAVVISLPRSQLSPRHTGE